MNGQTPVTYGPPLCDSTGLCEPQTSPPRPPPGVTTTIPSVYVVNNNGTDAFTAVDDNTRAVNNLDHTVTHGFVAIGFLLVFVLVLLMGVLVKLVEDKEDDGLADT